MVGRLERPADGAGRRVQRIELGVKPADVDGPIGPDRRRRDHVSGNERPPQRFAAGIEVVDVEVQRAPVARAVGGERRRRPQRVARRERPVLAAVGSDRVGGPAGVAGVQDPTGADGDVALPPVDSLCRDRRHGRAKSPDDPRRPPRRCRHVVQVVIGRPERQRHRVLRAVVARQGARRVDDPACLQSPAQPPVRRDRVEVRVGRSDIDGPVGPEHGRREDPAAGLQRPRQVAAVLRPDRAAAAVGAVVAHLRPRR